MEMKTAEISLWLSVRGVGDRTGGVQADPITRVSIVICTSLRGKKDCGDGGILVKCVSVLKHYYYYYYYYYFVFFGA
jgi:hypothetical protein